MSLTLREILALDAMRDARPEVLAGESALDRVVRWVHSSEIFEIGPLLSGGELLLTTGLGLAGMDAAARRRYVREIAERDVAGVALELGRTFPEVPGDLVDEARRRDMPFITLSSVVPFRRITEEANTRIVDQAGHRLRLGDSITRALNDVLIAGIGVPGLLATAAEVVGGPLVLVAENGALVATHGVADDREAWRIAEKSAAEAPVTVLGKTWGRLIAGPGTVLPPEDLAVALERTTAALALAMLRTGGPPRELDRLATALLTDLLEGTAEGRAELSVRASLAGFHPNTDQMLVGVAADAMETAAALAVLDRAARILRTPSLQGRVSRLVLGVLTVPRGLADAVGAVQQALDEALRRLSPPQVRIAVGHAATDLGGLGASLQEARTALDLRPDTRLVTARSIALDLELARYGDSAHLAQLVRGTITPIVEWDAAHRSDLLHSLETFLLCGCSATRAAAVLHLRRQSFYQRLQRIESLLGYPVTEPNVHSALLLAIAARRVAAGC